MEMEDRFVTFRMEKAKHIALVAHDGKKKEMVDWCDRNKEILKSHFLCGTGTTARLISEKTGLPVKGYNIPKEATSRSGQRSWKARLISWFFYHGSIGGAPLEFGCKSSYPDCSSS